MSERADTKLFRMSSGNECDVRMMRRGQGTVLFRAEWEDFPPSDRDKAECEAAIAEWLGALGLRPSCPVARVSREEASRNN